MKLFKSLKIAFLGFIALTSCSSDDDSGTTEKTIAETAQATPDLSILVAALQRADLVTTLNGNTEYTVFAPTNAAFNAFLSANSFASIDAVPIPVLKEILLNHVIAGTYESTNLTTGYVKTLAKGSASATNNMSMFINTSGSVTLNGGTSNGGATVTTADISASNGVVHIVNGVIGLPSIVNHAIANSDFSTLVSALTRDDQPDFAGILSGTGPLQFLHQPILPLEAFSPNYPWLA
jgi:uncharacterized surface protein with fasciclin (FAS1) repeats